MSATGGIYNGMYADGDFSVENLVGELPIIDPETGVTGYLYTYRQRLEEFRIANAGSRPHIPAFNSTDVHGAYLLESTQPRQAGSMAEWTRTYWHVPATRTTFEDFSMHYQLGESGGKILEAAKSVTARVVREYKYTTNPIADFPLTLAFRYYTLGDGPPFSEGTPIDPDAPDFLGEDQKRDQWKGKLSNIYVRTSRYVPKWGPTTS